MLEINEVRDSGKKMAVLEQPLCFAGQLLCACVIPERV